MEIKSTSAYKQCINISVVNNIVPDTPRQFELGASSNSHTLSTTISFVHILDDGKCVYLYHSLNTILKLIVGICVYIIHNVLQISCMLFYLYMYRN